MMNSPVYHHFSFCPQNCGQSNHFHLSSRPTLILDHLSPMSPNFIIFRPMFSFIFHSFIFVLFDPISGQSMPSPLPPFDSIFLFISPLPLATNTNAPEYSPISPHSPSFFLRSLAAHFCQRDSNPAAGNPLPIKRRLIFLLLFPSLFYLI